MKGKFITLEGIDGSGKTTQFNLLKDYLLKNTIPHIAIREPGSTTLGEHLRDILKNSHIPIDPISEAYLFAAARAQLTRQVIIPSLNKGLLVICDRFFHSSLAYQGVARGLGKDVISHINYHAVNNIKPHLTFFIDVPPQVANLRKGETSLDRIEQSGWEFQQLVYNAYINMAKQDDTIVKIPGDGPKEQINKEIISHLEKLMISHK